MLLACVAPATMKDNLLWVMVWMSDCVEGFSDGVAEGCVALEGPEEGTVTLVDGLGALVEVMVDVAEGVCEASEGKEVPEGVEVKERLSEVAFEAANAETAKDKA